MHHLPPSKQLLCQQLLDALAGCPDLLHLPGQQRVHAYARRFLAEQLDTHHLTPSVSSRPTESSGFAESSGSAETSGSTESSESAEKVAPVPVTVVLVPEMVVPVLVSLEIAVLSCPVSVFTLDALKAILLNSICFVLKFPMWRVCVS